MRNDSHDAVAVVITLRGASQPAEAKTQKLAFGECSDNETYPSSNVSIDSNVSCAATAIATATATAPAVATATANANATATATTAEFYNRNPT